MKISVTFERYVENYKSFIIKNYRKLFTKSKQACNPVTNL